MKRLYFFILTFLFLFFAFDPLTDSAVTEHTKEFPANNMKAVPSKEGKKDFLFFLANFLYHGKDKGAFNTLSDESILHSGDRYKIIFTPSVDCFVYIFQVDSAGKIFQLFPMESFGGVTVDNFNPVQQDKTYYLPAKGKSFQLDEQVGTEKIYFLASRERDLELEGLYQQAVEDQQQSKDELEIQLLEIDRILERAINVQGALSPADDHTGKISWEEEGQSFTILQERLENMCDGCLYVLSFEHR